MSFIKGMKFAMRVTRLFAATVMVCQAHAADPIGGVPPASTQVEASTQTPTLQPAQPQTPQYSEFYTINEKDTEVIDMPSKATINSGSPGISSIPSAFWVAPLKEVKTAMVNMLKWVQHKKALPLPEEKYIRKLHFGRWINDPNDDTCMNTRARVLVRDSEVEVTYKAPRQCTVEEGKWLDPYANQEATVAKQIQIDHLVPLKNAYDNGAFEWDYKTRCLYANYMNFRPHLVSAGAHENMSKSDKGPEGYLPPNEDYRCEYIRNWLAVKTIWNLRLNPKEAEAIAQVVKDYKCNVKAFLMTQDGMNKQRQFIQDNLEFCMINKR